MYVPGTDVRKRAVHTHSFIAKSGILSVDEGIALDKGANLEQVQAAADADFKGVGFVELSTDENRVTDTSVPAVTVVPEL